jgi:ribosomal protein S18 acetylase RimI-like enzyme
VTVRTVDVDSDLNDIVALFLESWRDHWGFVELPFDQALADWRKGIRGDGERFDPTLWFLAVHGDEIVGISLCNSHIADDATRGYVQVLGVRPAWRKRGIALALLHHTFAEFRRRGYAAVELDMDSENLTGALRVYERAGMRAVRQSLSCEKELRAGIDLATRSLAP